MPRVVAVHPVSVVARLFVGIPVAARTLARAVLAALVLGCSVAAWHACGPAEHAGRVVVDCARQDQARIDSLLLKFGVLLVGEVPDWSAIYHEAVVAGVEVGGCALATFVKEHESSEVAGRPEPAVADSTQTGRATLEEFRSRNASNAVFRTTKFGDV